MTKLSNSKIIKIVTTLLTLLLVSKFMSLGLWWYLPSEGVELNAKKSYQAKYQRVDLKNMIIMEKIVNKPIVQIESSYNINNLVLKGLYGSKFNGFAIIAKKISPKVTTIVEVSEEYEGYKLKEILLTKVLFTKNSKEYALELEMSASLSKASKSSVTKVQKSRYEPVRRVTKKDITSYSRNPSQIWRDIAISEVKENGKIAGFRVNKIAPNSKMAELGLQKGDVIIKANNIELRSYNDAIKLYKNIGTLDSIELVIIRDNQEKEIIYEIN